jgi:hypothetical protein
LEAARREWFTGPKNKQSHRADDRK